MAGKGSKRRPLKIAKEQFEKNWDLIFAKTKEQLLEQEPPEHVKERRKYCDRHNAEVGVDK